MRRAPQDAAPGPRAGDAGVTLVEMLVVIALVGVLAGLATLSIGRLQGGETVARHADTLAARLTIAAETAATTGRDAAFVWTPAGYRFVVWEAGEWRPHPAPELGRAERFAALDLGAEGAGRGSLVIGADLAAPDPSPFRLALSDGRALVEVLFDGVSARTQAAPG